mmetsp:Transcript_21247/g.46630  ORF Transcript_21247/g.46630 Transcript_21247/m.46630 type:complete len:259 (+) Transcript_21247:820-1596(+)
MVLCRPPPRSHAHDVDALQRRSLVNCGALNAEMSDKFPVRTQHIHVFLFWGCTFLHFEAGPGEATQSCRQLGRPVEQGHAIDGYTHGFVNLGEMAVVCTWLWQRRHLWNLQTQIIHSFGCIHLLISGGRLAETLREFGNDDGQVAIYSSGCCRRYLIPSVRPWFRHPFLGGRTKNKSFAGNGSLHLRTQPPGTQAQHLPHRLAQARSVVIARRIIRRERRRTMQQPLDHHSVEILVFNELGHGPEGGGCCRPDHCRPV